MSTHPTDRLIVVGAGTAGLACAVAAARAGTRVLLLEKDDDIGGTLHISGGHLSAGGTRRQRERGIADTPDAHLDDVMRISRGTARADLARLAVDLAPRTVDDLDVDGFEFAPESPRLFYGHEPYGVPRTHYGVDEARSILAVQRRRLAPLVESGLVELRLGTAVTSLLVEDGRVVGVRIPAGEERGRAVVLTTGGFSAAPDLFAEIERAPLVSAGRRTSTGDGLRMARDLGAAVVGQGAWLPTFGGLREDADPGRMDWGYRPLLTKERPPAEIYVDRHGERFMAEDEPSIDEKERILSTLPGLTFWQVVDDAALEASRTTRPFVNGASLDELRAAAGSHAAIHTAETIEELARLAGIDPAGLVTTVQRYNAAVDAGRDPDFGRTHLPSRLETPPFYALENHGTTLITFAGVDVDGDLRVRRDDGTVVEGLYAAGEILGAAATTGNAFCGGMLLTPALSFGRLLGERLSAVATAERRAG